MKHVELSKKVPPDGGYGWVIVFAMALSSFIYVPMIHCFGLIFKDTFVELGLSATQGSLIVNLHAAFGMMTGLLNGVLLKMFGYRKIALLAAILYFSGVTLTTFARSFQYFIVSYGLVASLGMGMSRSSYGLALNTYFKNKRSKALSLSVTVTGLGTIVIPQLINALMKFYTPQGVILIFGGVCAHFFVAAILLQPVKWHMKDDEKLTNEVEQSNQMSRYTPVAVSRYDLEADDGHLCLQADRKERGKSHFSKITKIFDLDLLKDPIFVNILVGMSLGIFAELNFMILIPFILDDFGLTDDQIATFMSTSAAADMAFRLLAPYIADYLKQPARIMYLITLVILIVMRFVLLMSTSFYVILTSAVGLGVGKGIRKVFMGLIVPSHVSLERLPSASGMEMMANGICILAGGSLLGVVRDVTGSYYLCIIIMNCVTAITIIMWTLEGVIIKWITKPAKNPEIEGNELLEKM